MPSRALLVVSLISALACAGGAPDPAPSVEVPAVDALAPVGASAAGEVPPLDKTARYAFPNDKPDVLLKYWRSKGPWEGPWSTPVAAGVDGAGWTWFAYESTDVEALRDAWLRSLSDEVVWRSADGAEIWTDGGTVTSVRTSLRDGRAVVNARLWRREVPAEMPTDPFCPPELRPDFRYDDDGAILQRGCRSVGEDSKHDGPFELHDGDAVLVGERDGYDLDGDVSISVSGRVVASGRYAGGKPDGPWRYDDRTVTWRDGDPDPPWLDGVLPDGGAGTPTTASASRIEILDHDLGLGQIAWRIVYATSRSEVDVEVRPCGYPGLAPTEGVRLAYSDAVQRSTTTWDVYWSVGGDDSCTSDAEATERLAAAKAA